jgi:rubrerythrin
MDILVYAIKMELDGEKYYKEQAERNRGNSLYKVFMDLAKDESDHAKILEDKARGLFYRLNAPVPSSVQNVFAGLSGLKGISCCQDQADVYKAALEKEKQSIDLYKKLLSESGGDKELYDYLIAQEEEHYAIIEEIIKVVSRPEEWVEAAEFGEREEY